jgi:hypothetical protein
MDPVSAPTLPQPALPQPLSPAGVVESAHKTAPPFDWNETSRKAVRLVAADKLTDREISAKLGIATGTLTRWKRRPEFARKVVSLRARMGELAERYALTKKARRLADLVGHALQFIVRHTR